MLKATKLKVEVIARRSPAWLAPFTGQSVRTVREHLLRSQLSPKLRSKLQAAKKVTVVFVGSDEIAKLNLEFRGKDKPTDVLSFAPIEADSLGELVVAMPVVRAQAKMNQHSVQSELAYMLLHGILHLLGLDHGRVMFGIQDAVFDELRENWLS